MKVSSSCPGVRPSGLKPTLGSVTVTIQDPGVLSILGQHGTDCQATDKAFLPKDRWHLETPSQQSPPMC